jgi:hypothetical protein
MSTPTYPKVVYTLHGDGLSVAYSPNEGTLDIEGEDVLIGRRHFAGADLATTTDDFSTFATACLLPSNRAGIGFFITIVVPNGIVPDAEFEVEGVAISIERTADDARNYVGWSVRPLKGTVASTN